MKNVCFLSVVVCLLAFIPASSAALIDLTVTDALGEGNGSGTANGALIYHAMLVKEDARMHNNETGSIMQIQKDGTEIGYNTGGTAQFDTSKTQDVVYSAMTAREMEGTMYYEFVVKINETGGNPGELLTINEIRIYTSPTASISTTVLADLGTLRWNLDGDENNSVNLDYSLGEIRTNDLDMVYYVPVALFDGVADTDYVYMYYELGDDLTNPAAYSSNDGFEEMFLFTVEYYGDVPEPAR